MPPLKLLHSSNLPVKKKNTLSMTKKKSRNIFRPSRLPNCIGQLEILGQSRWGAFLGFATIIALYAIELSSGI